MPRGRPKAQLNLSQSGREQLLRWVRRGQTAQALAIRARIVLRCADGACLAHAWRGVWIGGVAMVATVLVPAVLRLSVRPRSLCLEQGEAGFAQQVR